MNKQEAAKILDLTGELTKALIKKAYKKASFKFHPDRNPNGLEMMKSVNLAYAILKDFSGCIDSQANDDSQYLPANIINAINAIIGIDGLEVELCGNWLWVTGDTKANKEVLKEHSFRWSPKKVAWYLKPEGYKSKGRGKFSMENIRDNHGSKALKGASKKRIAA